ncbi:MAG: tetratricopeptide repeat protein [Aequorivita sp.]
MNTKNEYADKSAILHQIDQYLLGHLEGDELRSFKKRLEQDPEFSKTVAEQRLLIEGIGEFHLKKQLDRYHSQMELENVNKKPLAIWLAIAASVVILIGISFWAISDTETAAQKVFAKNFQPDPGLPTTMGATSDYEFYSGMVSYKRKEYSDAIALWESLYSANPKNDTLIYFLGVAYLAEGNNEQAERYLKVAQTRKGSMFAEEAIYYLALTQLRENKVQEAKKTLENSSFPASIGLLEQIKRLR